MEAPTATCRTACVHRLRCCVNGSRPAPPSMCAAAWRGWPKAWPKCCASSWVMRWSRSCSRKGATCATCTEPAGSRLHGVEPSTGVLCLLALQPAEHHRMPENALHVGACLVVRDVLDPDVRGQRCRGEPALRG